MITPQTSIEVLGHHFNEFKYMPAAGTRGGIMLGWHTDFMEASNLELRRFLLSMTIRPTWMSVLFLLTMVYNPSDDVDKPEFLSELLSIMPNSSVQWIVLGDFNLIYEAHDKNNLNLNRHSSDVPWTDVSFPNSPCKITNIPGVMSVPNQR
jgi:hypothetical protein